MIRLVIILLFLICLRCQAQDSIICIPLKMGWLLERDRQKMMKFDTLARERQERLIVLEKVIIKEDSINLLHEKKESAKDSSMHEKDGEIKNLKQIIANQPKIKVKWWWVPLAAFGGWLLGH